HRRERRRRALRPLQPRSLDGRARAAHRGRRLLAALVGAGDGAQGRGPRRGRSRRCPRRAHGRPRRRRPHARADRARPRARRLVRHRQGRRVSVYQTKGTTLLSMQAVLDRRLGAGAFKRLATATGATWGLPLANGLYDAEELCRLTTAAATELGTTQLELFTASSEHNARHDLPTIHRIVLRVITPQLLLARGARFWRSYTAFGETRVARNEPGAFTGITDGIPPQLKD